MSGMSSETLKKTRHDLDEAAAFLADKTFPSEYEALIKAMREDDRIKALCPSAKCAVESVLCSLAAAVQGKGLPVWLGGEPSHLPSAVLLQGALDQVLDQARAGLKAGAAVYKLKVGDRNVALDVKKLQELRQVIGDQGMIRLDANRAWQLPDALLFARLAGLDRIEFIEEPVADMGRVNEFYAVSRMPVALDESLQVMRCGVSAPGRCSPPLVSSDAVAAFIIKPMILGGIIPALDWIAEAKALGKKAVISSTFETPAGMAILESLACLTPTAPGLDTRKWFKKS